MNAIISKNIFFFVVFASVIFAFHACKNKESAKENTVLQQKTEDSEKVTAPENAFQTEINSADIRLELRNPVIDRDFETLGMAIVNNSEYRLSTGSAFTIKFLESGRWDVIPAFENTIWTDEEIPVYPRSSREYGFFYGFYNFDFVSGKYRIEKNVKFVNPIDNNIRHIVGERTLVAEFEIK
ncbi:immunoglobulin-like domain-containing protein [Petrimonas sp.]|uniref:immunoglobulin-like domain-containing protein n=1 Tax=Petrimonas sp. TaxID=2023866 RepID=UPI003F5164F5